jgi:hypothetical protein
VAIPPQFVWIATVVRRALGRERAGFGRAEVKDEKRKNEK